MFLPSSKGLSETLLSRFWLNSKIFPSDKEIFYGTSPVVAYKDVNCPKECTGLCHISISKTFGTDRPSVYFPGGGSMRSQNLMRKAEREGGTIFPLNFKVLG